MHFYLFRHGQTDWNAQERFQGHANIPLNALGLKQAAELGESLRSQGLTHLLSSDLERAFVTAQLVGKKLNIAQIQTDPRLREANLGQAQGLTRQEIQTRFGQTLLDRWKSSHPEDRLAHYPEGETGEAVLKRALAALENFQENFQKSFSTVDQEQIHVGVATHGGVIRRILQAIHPEPHRYHPIPNTVLYEIRFAPHAAWKFEFLRRIL